MRTVLRLAALASLAGLGPAAFASTYKDVIPGARAMGLGYAVTSLASDDPFSIFYNAAGPANTPYVQAAATMGRFESPRGTLVLGALSYLRPFERINSATIGAGYFVERQDRGGDKDVFDFHYSQEIKVPRLPLSKPLRVGGNFKFVNAENLDGAGFGVGFDGGLLVRSNMGFALGVSVHDLTTNYGMPRMTWGLGVSYAWAKRVTLAADMRIRSGLTEFYPGIEVSFLQGLLKARMGRGMRLDLVDTVAAGLGLNFSPLILDIAMAIPTAGVFREGGAYQMSASYRFGAPPFSGSFVGAAASEAEALRTQINLLEERKRTLETESQAAQSNRTAVDEELGAAQKRLEETQEQYRKVMKKRDEEAYQLRLIEQRLPKPPAPPPKPKPKPKPPKVWPERHLVKPGDTLRSIANEHYGDSGLWELVYEANRDKVERGFPREGEVLTIPEPRGGR